MNIKKILKVTLLSFLGFVVLGVLTLVIHIAMVSGGASQMDQYKANLQLARVDFEQPLSDEEKSDFTDALTKTEGFNKLYFNPNNKTVVFAYDHSKTTNQEFYNKVIANTDLVDGKLFVADAALLAAGCPVIDKSSITYRITSGIEKLTKKLF